MPQDPVILLSWVNLKLRDFYPNLEELCASLGAEQQEIEEALGKLDYHYDSNANQFL
ncbi:MAG: DUF4250 domain-containing protein [Lachnospiraceae bacterium]|jgi:hypothetical protein|nr:DUF4250 domain-containing protein [Lachnospiraceae bacterium]